MLGHSNRRSHSLQSLEEQTKDESALRKKKMEATDRQQRNAMQANITSSPSLFTSLSQDTSKRKDADIKVAAPAPQSMQDTRF